MSSNFASLHAGLVARKGEAVPAVSHQAFSYVDAPQSPVQTGAEVSIDNQPPLVAARAHAPRKSPAGSKSLPKEAKRPPARFQLTFRMTHDQRRRIRIAAAQRDVSLQYILSEALDGYLDGLSACVLNECSCLSREEGA